MYSSGGATVRVVATPCSGSEKAGSSASATIAAWEGCS